MTTKVKFGAPKKAKAVPVKKKVVDAPVKKKVKEVEAPVMKKKKAKTATESSAGPDYIVLGKTTAIQIVETDKGEVQIQKFYCTSADPEWKRAKGGFNLPKDEAILKQVRKGLKRFME